MSDSTEKPRGLWSVMSQRKVDDEQQDDRSETKDALPSSEDSEAEPAPTESAPKGLWAVMNQSANVVDHGIDEQPTGIDEVDRKSETAETLRLASNEAPAALESELLVDEESTQTAVDAPYDEPAGIDLQVDVAASPNYQRLAVKTGRSTQALAACLTGLFAIPLAALALLPEPWLRLPSTGAGFVALMLGLLGWQDVRTSRGRQTGIELAWAGAVLGVLAMFLGPVVFARLGQGYRKSFGRQQSIANLETIGAGLLTHHGERGQFPAGGIFRAQENAEQQAMHGWMTTLLPYIGEETLHNSIQLNVPFDAAANRPAMRQSVNSYLAAGASGDGIGRHKLAPAHFSGVGGEMRIEGVGLVRAGIFGRNSDTTREDITDGLSQTFVAGEISAFYPAWGEPENWRLIGRGLNRDSAGFGNAAGSGALFLRADGSVKFYSNETDPTLLRQLSTLNAGDFIAQ